MNVLEIGAGTGYNAALMQEIVDRAGHIIDIQDDVVEQTRRLLKASGYGGIEVIAADGAEGFSKIPHMINCHCRLSRHLLSLG